MSLRNPRAAPPDGFRIGGFNLPTVTLFVLSVCVFSLVLIKPLKPLESLLAQAVFISCPLASLAGLATLVWCLVKRKKLTGETRGGHFWKAVFIGAAAFSSPIWIIILSVMILGFNR